MKRSRRNKILRKLGKEDSAIGVYARMQLALDAEKGIRLDPDDLYRVLVRDSAVETALEEAIYEEEQDEADRAEGKEGQEP